MSQLQEKQPSKLAAKHETTLGNQLCHFWCYGMEDIQAMFLSLFFLVEVNRTYPLLVFRKLIPIDSKETRTFTLGRGGGVC